LVICNVNDRISIIKFGTDTKKKQETNCLIILAGKSSELKCSEFSTEENRKIKMRRKNSVYSIIQNMTTLLEAALKAIQTVIV